MSEIIEVSLQLYERLGKHAQGFEPPASVIERLLDTYEGVEKKKTGSPKPLHETTKAHPRNHDKFIFEDRVYGKGRLVLAVITAHVKSNPDTSLNVLLDTFPRDLQGSFGVFDKKDVAEETFKNTQHKRHYIKHDEVIRLTDEVIAVSNQWGSGNIDRFIERARSLGYVITPKPEAGQGPA